MAQDHLATEKGWRCLQLLMGGRRFCLVVGCCLIYTALLVGGYLDSGAYVALQTLTVGAYIAGNGAQKYAETRYGTRTPTEIS